MYVNEHTLTYSFHPTLPLPSSLFTCVQVSWYFPGLSAQAKLESYTITCREDRSDDIIFEITQSINEPTEIIISSTEDTPLRPYTVYVVTVWANYASGERLSEYVTVVTSEAKPSPPIGVTGEAINITAILLHWMVRIHIMFICDTVKQNGEGRENELKQEIQRGGYCSL